MRLNIKDNHDVNKIISSLTEDDLEIIEREVNRLCDLKKQNPFISAIYDYEESEFTKLAGDWLSLSDCDFQEKIHRAMWDFLCVRVSREYAIAQFLHRLSEVA